MGNFLQMSDGYETVTGPGFIIASTNCRQSSLIFALLLILLHCSNFLTAEAGRTNPWLSNTESVIWLLNSGECAASFTMRPIKDFKAGERR